MILQAYNKSTKSRECSKDTAEVTNVLCMDVPAGHTFIWSNAAEGFPEDRRLVWDEAYVTLKRYSAPVRQAVKAANNSLLSRLLKERSKAPEARYAFAATSAALVLNSWTFVYD